MIWVQVHVTSAADSRQSYLVGAGLVVGLWPAMSSHKVTLMLLARYQETEMRVTETREFQTVLSSTARSKSITKSLKQTELTSYHTREA